MTTPTFMMALIDTSKASIIVFILELCETNLKGLKILRSLSTLINGIFTPDNLKCKYYDSYVKSMRPVITIKESSLFQASVRYAPSSITKPNAIILIVISIVNSA